MKKYLFLILFFVMTFASGCFNSNKQNLDTAEMTGIAMSGSVETSYYTSDTQFDLNDAELIIYFNDDSKQQIQLKDDMLSEFDNSVGTHTATITYDGMTTTFKYNVNSVRITRLYLDNPLTHNYFTSNTDFVLNGMKLTAYYNDGSVEKINVTKNMVSAFDNSYGTHTATVTYMGKTTTFKYFVDYTEADIESIEVNSVLRAKYITTDTKFYSSGGIYGTINVVYQSGSSQMINITSSMLSAFDNSVGTHTATVTYMGKTTTFEYTVEHTDGDIDSIEVASVLRTEYVTTNTYFYSSGGSYGTINVVYQSGRSQTINITSSMLSAFDNSVGTHTATVSYMGKTTTFEYSVLARNTVLRLEIANLYETNYLTTDTDFYSKNERYGFLDVWFADGTESQVAIRSENISAFDNSAGTHTGTITYSGVSINFTYTVNQAYNIVTECVNSFTPLEYGKEVAVPGEKISLSLEPHDESHILEKLVYVKGVYENSEFTPSSDTQYTIYNNEFIMPDSDIKIICVYREREQQATISSVTVDVNEWMEDNYVLAMLYIRLDGEIYLDQDNLGYTGNFDGILTWDFTQEKTTYTITDYTLSSVTFAVGLDFVASETYIRNEGVGRIDSNQGWTPVELTHFNNNTYYIRKQVTVILKLYDQVLNVTETRNIVFTLDVYFDVKNEYSVTFVEDGAQHELEIYRTGETITPPSEGKWYTDKECTIEWDFDTTINSDMVLYTK